MKGIWIGEDDELGLRHGKEYEIVGYCRGLDAYAVYDEVGGPYLYDIDGFEITEQFPLPPEKD